MARHLTWLVFSEAQQGRWWSRCLKPGFRHVSILTLDGGIWILTRPLYGYTDVVACPYAQGDRPQDLIDGDALIIPIDIHPNDRLRSLVGLHTCVSWAKAMMGIRERWIITPYQLYRYCARDYTVDISSTGRAYSGSIHQSESHPTR